jgi:murein tripeptide amidase MpaA
MNMNIYKKTLSALFFVFCIVSILQAQAPETYSRARIYIEGKNIQQLLETGVALDHGVHNKKFIENDFSAAELALVQEAGFRTEILIEDVSAYYRHQNLDAVKSQLLIGCNVLAGVQAPNYQTPTNFQLGSMAGYYTYQELLDELDSMRAKYPQLISSRQIINPSELTHEGRPIYWLRISDNPNIDENEPEALYNALHHAREPMSLSQLVYFMWYILENYSSDDNIKTLIDNTELYFVPCVNPDGYIYNATTNPGGGGMWRKNRRNNNDGTFGVDLNRNYSYNWGFNNQGSSPNSSSDTYRGTAAFSEPETKNMRDFSLAHDFVVNFNYHSYGNLMVYPWAYSGLESADSAYYRLIAPMLTRFNNFSSGTGAETVGYSSNGEADDWQYGEQVLKNKTFSLTPEVGDAAFGFWPPSTNIEGICKSTLWQNLSQSYLLLNFGLAKDISSPLLNQTANQIAFEISKFGFQNGLLTVSLEPLSSNIASVGNDKSFTLTQLQSQRDSILLTLNSGLQNGDLVRFVIHVDNSAGLIISDTISKIYGAYNPVFTDNGNSLANWVNLGTTSNWQTTTGSFYSAPSSITDSDGTDYPQNAVSDIILINRIDLREVIDATLNFWAKWDIENDYDYVQISAANASGNFIPLCGIYTNTGSNFQANGEPLFDSQQSVWVQESMSLNDFLGDSAVVLKISLRSDQWVEGDGFYFDDMTVSFLTESPVGSGIQRQLLPLLGQNVPNPADQLVFIPFKNLEQYGMSELKLRVTDAFGRVMAFMPISINASGINLETGQWAAGIYFYQLIGEKGSSETLQMVIAK